MNSIINLVRFCGVIKSYDEHNSNIISCLKLGWVVARRGRRGKIGGICNSITYASSERDLASQRVPGGKFCVEYLSLPCMPCGHF